MSNTSHKKKVFSAIGSVLMLGSLVPFSPAGAVDDAAQSSIESPRVDGKSSESAAASCFEIKQLDPESKSGTYWLYTPAMNAPAQFYCDQETNGGGWVMVGRGREGWTEQYAGQGDPQELVNHPSGKEAFRPVQLSSQSIDQLMNNENLSDQPNGMLVKRAMDQAGSVTQSVSFKPQQRERWSWKFSKYAPYTGFQFSQSDKPGESVTKSDSNDIIRIDGNSSYTLRFEDRKDVNWQFGFGFGPHVKGSPAADSYLWTPAEGGAGALPFSQVFIKPQLTQQNVSFAQTPDSGSAEKTQRAMPQSLSEKVNWRTADESGTGVRNIDNSLVQSFTQVGNTVFSGGDFKYVEKASTGERVDQKFLAGFDVNTGELVRSFAPSFNNQVKAVAALPNNRIAVGGQFTVVNGEKHAGFVVLDATTGQIDKELSTQLENLTSVGVVKVNDLLVAGNYLYIGGLFTHLTNPGDSYRTYSRNAARIDLSVNRVDRQWRPEFNGSVNGLSTAPDDSAVYAAGFFSTLHGESTLRLAAMNSTDGRRLAPWQLITSDPVRYGVVNHDYQYAVQGIAGTVWSGGSEHILSKYNTADFSREYSAITRGGGDFQSLSLNDDVLFASCHCGEAVYEGATEWRAPHTQKSFFNMNQIRLIGAWDPVTGRQLPDFNPQLSGRNGYGVWDSFTDSNGVLWVGGDINRSMGVQGYAQKTVGFARFAPRDAVAPAAPAQLSVKSESGKDQLTWAASGEPGVTYQIIRDNKVIASAESLSYSVDHADGAWYFVRAADQAGNISASTSVAIAETLPARPGSESNNGSHPSPEPTPDSTSMTSITQGKN